MWVLCSVHVITLQWTYGYSTVYMWVLYSVHGGSLQCTCEYLTVYMWLLYSVHVSTLHCTCDYSTVYSVYVVTLQCTYGYSTVYMWLHVVTLQCTCGLTLQCTLQCTQVHTAEWTCEYRQQCSEASLSLGTSHTPTPCRHTVWQKCHYSHTHILGTPSFGEVSLLTPTSGDTKSGRAVATHTHSLVK